MSMKFLKTVAGAAVSSLWEKVSGNVVLKDTSADVGIGGATPSDFTYANSLVIKEKANYDGLTIYTADTTHSGSIYFADGTGGGADSYRGHIEYDHDNDLMRIGANSGAKLYIEGGGDINVRTGNVVINTAGKGIDFSNQAQSPTGATTGELLDHYEIGTFTPTVTGVTSISYTTQNGYYTRVGNIVYVKFYLLASWTASSTLVLNGLPFTVGTSGDYLGVSYQTAEAGIAPTFYTGGSSTVATAYEAGNTVWQPPTGTDKYVIGSGTYTLQ